ncbi:PREDICTED: protein WUSCHEL [Nelumbo nucifera]|uniref:Protein WUSCHEL n=2 Tax=Nelumbo nucifera TaxID=4432 RepID=A0A1U8AMM3_NELNU|nr:PREDICTED: protein WUSCHEL [Nelumbo nucifera]DAD22368.1 TPA_asm: hypothetical protein HUJ06_023831 [Nelumbo nucifera]
MEPQQQPAQQMQQQQQPNEDSSSSNTSKSSFLCRQSSTRWTPTTDQIRILKDLYYNNGIRSPSAEQIQRISARLRQYGKIEGKNVFYWFQNHKARERQKKRFTVDMAMQRSVATGGWKTGDPIHNKYTNISPGVSSPSSPGVLAAGQMGGTGYGPVLMEKSFRDCSISAGGSGIGGGGMCNNLGWVGIDPYSSPYALFDKRKSIEYLEDQTPQIETLPLFPTHGENIGGFCTGKADSGGYFTDWYGPSDEKNDTPTSLELSLNSCTTTSPDSP